MDNRINITFDEQGFQNTLKAATDCVTLVNSYAKEVKPDDRIKGQNMGDKNGWTYVQKAFQALTNDRNLVHPHLVDYDAFAKGVDTAQKLLEIRNKLNGWVGNAEGTFIVLGIDLMAQANEVWAALKKLAKSNSQYQLVFNDLNFLYENRAAKAANTIETQKRIDELQKQLDETLKKVQ